MSQQGIYVLCYRAKLEKIDLITANFYHLQGLWLKGCLKMHFLQVECKSSSRSWSDPDLQLRGGQIMKWGFGGGSPRGYRGKAPGQGSEGRSLPEADDSFLFQRLISSQNYHINL